MSKACEERMAKVARDAWDERGAEWSGRLNDKTAHAIRNEAADHIADAIAATGALTIDRYVIRYHVAAHLRASDGGFLIECDVDGIGRDLARFDKQA
jgi:hypothetical protein